MAVIQGLTERLILLRQAIGLNQEAVGAELGLTKSGISSFEKGKSVPSPENLLKLARLFNVTVDYLLTGKGLLLIDDLEREIHLQPKKGERASSATRSQNILPYPANQNNVQALGLLSDIPVIELGRVSFKARASFNYAQLQRFMSSELFDKVLFRLPPGRTAEDYQDALVFDIEGDSMEPSLRDGQQVIAWPVPEGKWEYLHNTICVVDYDDTVAVKAILKNDLNNTEGLTLHATGGVGGSFTVARKDIHSIWEVREFYGVVPVRLVAA